MVGVFFLASQNDCRNFPPYPAGASMLALALPAQVLECILIGPIWVTFPAPPQPVTVATGLECADWLSPCRRLHP